ncbi:UDP-N-acetylmuramoyl-tripeptide--D-alanyl-D-alanine ligase [Desulfomicrobium escambiense]|uniref:UDP-N-acetylmuramoyl-tripeptide--D-alanyl-D- alanine ligase n=1 Tax=Desulfomicrobium escambiense TaxID=29503 RepID=UPI00040BD1A5|nr:UDP-N-acetylmuramoyl-tripeptide--D-alanyl-D-alanine ligase [Desulfomicrobium escambiense]
MNMTLQDISAAMGASIDQDHERVIRRVSIDSRAVQPDDLFFCIVGQKLDGHEFARQAVDNGAVAVVASTPLELPVPVLLVRDTTLALGRLARSWRERTAARVVGVSGSAGKTTVKEMLAQVLSLHSSASKNFRNLNNQIGLPLSILEMSGEEDFWVLELGISRPGDMDELGYILAPDAALLINIGGCHLEGLGSLHGVAEQKSVLLDHVRPGGFACVSADYPLLATECAKRSLRQFTFSGCGADADYSCTGQENTPDGILYALRAKGRDIRLHVSATVHVPENVAAVTAMALELGVPTRTIEAGLAAFSPVAQRFVQNRVGAWLFIDDTYNANPVSMAQSIREAERIAQGQRLVLVLGEMRELGEDSARAHRELGALVASTSATHCFFHGRHVSDVQSGLGEHHGVFSAVNSGEELLQAVASLRGEGGVMLFKGSRGCRMEQYYSFMERAWA